MTPAALARGLGGAYPRAADTAIPVLSDIHHPKLAPVIIAVIIAVLAVWLLVAFSAWRRVTWRDQMDTPISLLPKQARRDGDWAAWKIFARQEEVDQPSLVLLRIRNSGFAAISKASIRRPLTFTFPNREVKEFTVTDCRGVTRDLIEPPGGQAAAITGNRITLPRFPLRPRASFKMLVLLSGTARGVLGKGRIRRGKVVHESLARSPLARNVSFGAALVLLIGVQAGITFGQGPVIPSFCGSGHLTLEGSTAFAPVAQQIGQAYTSTCRDASVSVEAIATFNGLNAVNASGTRKDPPDVAQIAMSDGPAPSGYPALTGHPVAVVIFAVVLNKQDNVFNLTVGELREIFAGKITNWRQVGGADLPVRIVARVTGSGTRRAFDDEVLDGTEPAFSSYNCVNKDAVPSSPVIKCELTDTATLVQRVNAIPGAIGYSQISDAANARNVVTAKLNGTDPTIGSVEQGSYPYWAAEYLYTKGTPAPGSLAASFLAYMDSDTAKDLLRSQAYTPCVDRGVSLMNTLCRPGRPEN